MLEKLTKSVYLFLFLVVALATSNDLQTAEPSASTPGNTKICLTMIVKNESRIIERMLNSVKDVVDCISICDTGSSDNTVELIEAFLQKNAMPGKVHHEVWRNFGHNRTLSVKLAQQTLKELNFPLEQTYLLLLDADMLLQVKPDFTKENLKADTYSVIQENPIISYYNTRLIKASLPWECVGVTHEYWHSYEAKSCQELHTLVIDDREDGGCKADKTERDIRLLTQGIKDEPNNVRYFFYLAQSYKDIGQYDEAIKWYKQRIEKGGWYEEVFYSMMSIGDIYAAKNDWNQALQWYLNAYQANPGRAEPLYKIACYYRHKGDKQLAYMFAKQGSKIPYPINQHLFIYRLVYDYQLDEELSIAADQTLFREDGYAAVNRLMLKTTVPKRHRDQAYRNLKFYIENLKNASFQIIGLSGVAKSDVTGQETNVSFVKDGSIYVLQSFTPFTIQQMNSDGILEPMLECVPTHDFSGFQAAAAPLEFDEGYLLLVHEVVPFEEQYSIHRFVYLDNTFNIKKVTKPFTFMHKGFEYCSEMKIDQSEKTLVLPVTIGDRKSYSCSVDLETVRSLLEPLP